MLKWEERASANYGKCVCRHMLISICWYLCLWAVRRKRLDQVQHVLHRTAFCKVGVGAQSPGIMKPLTAKDSLWCDGRIPCTQKNTYVQQASLEITVKRPRRERQTAPGWPVNLRTSCVTLPMTSWSESVSIYSDSCPAIQPHNRWPNLDIFKLEWAHMN